MEASVEAGRGWGQKRAELWLLETKSLNFQTVALPGVLTISLV